MKNLVAVFVTFCFVFALVGIVIAADMKVEGKVEKMDGEYVSILDAKGKTHKVHTNDTTKKMGEIKEGADVEATVTAEGHAKSIMVKGMDMKDDMKGGMKDK